MSQEPICEDNLYISQDVCFHYPKVRFYTMEQETEISQNVSARSSDLRLFLDGKEAQPISVFIGCNADGHLGDKSNRLFLDLEFTPKYFRVGSRLDKSFESVLKSGKDSDNPANLDEVYLIHSSSKPQLNESQSEYNESFDPDQLFEYVLVLGDKPVQMFKFEYGSSEYSGVITIKTSIAIGSLEN